MKKFLSFLKLLIGSGEGKTFVKSRFSRAKREGKAAKKSARPLSQTLFP